MIQAYVDDSGKKGQSPAFIFLALIAEAELMAHIADAWQRVLDDSPRLKYFKMDEAASCDGQFYGFLETERDEKLRRFCNILATDSLTEFSFSMPFSVFDKTLGSAPRPLSEPYFFPFQCTILGIACDLHERGQKEPFEIFFDEDVIFGPRARAWYPVAKATLAGEAFYGILPTEPFFRDDESTLPLQAADLIAWIRRKANSPEGLEYFEWLPRALTGLRQSAFSKEFRQDMGEAILQGNKRVLTPELAAQRQAALDAYRETFGHEWPPRTKEQLKKARGRNKKR